MKGVDVVVYPSISSEKSLPFQAISTGTMVLVISPTVALIEDQIDDSLILLLSCLVSDDVLILHNAKKGISIITLTSRNAIIDKNI